MATNHPKDVSSEDEKPFDQIVIAPHKLKYINTKHKKVSAKMYDYKCDIKLRVCTSNFKAHKEVLSEASDYFSAMFSHDMLEKEQDVIELLEISPDGFALLLDYFYHGHVTLEPETIEDVIEAARFFQVDWVVEVACDYLIHQLSIDNYQTVLMLADKYLLGDLRGDIFRFLGINITRLAKEKDFYLNFDLELLTKFLKEDVYIEADEEFVLELVTNWVAARQEERKDYLLPLLRLVRFPLLEPNSLDKVSVKLDLHRWPEVADAVEEAKHYSNCIPAQSLFRGQRFCARGANPTVVMFSFGPEECTVTYQDAVDPSRRCQEELRGSDTSLDTELESASVARLGNFLYRTGGYDATVCSSAEMSRYDPRYRNWTCLASMNQARVSHAMCASEDMLFVFGGINHTIGEFGDEDTILHSMEVYDVRENTWQEMDSLLPGGSGSYNQAAAYEDGALYLSGGISSDPFDSVPMSGLWRFRLGSDRGRGTFGGGSWRSCRDMLYTRQGHSMTSLNSKLYVFGGYTAVGNNGPFRDCLASEVYDIETNQWTELRPTPDTFGHVMRSVGFYAGKIFLYGNGCLHTYHIEEDRMEYGDYYGLSIQKIAFCNIVVVVAAEVIVAVVVVAAVVVVVVAAAVVTGVVVVVVAAAAVVVVVEVAVAAAAKHSKQ
ncbi:kelch-like protein 9 [Elysia marginata]|uniref:Kelch-like protein 9 n=1 Tax=Elysia marginata TaxID=1093978 RepID=A0AAV4EEZ5_9GAST|nr:kelch-like protein 9 [Elysia marginata]